MQPPVAPVESQRLEAHGHVRIDPYYWMREREDPRVREYIDAENEYTRARLARTEALQQTLFDEFRTRIPLDDQSVPVRVGHWWYSTRFERDKSYPILCRRRTPESEDEVVVDDNELAEGLAYCDVGAHAISPDGNVLALAIDTVGRRQYALRFLDLRTRVLSEVEVEGTGGSVVWAADNRTVFYTRKDPVTLRSCSVHRHRVGTAASDDVCVFEEPDATFYVGLGKTKSGDFIRILCEQTLRTEVLTIPADRPEAAPEVFHPRGGTHEYDVDHVGDFWWICSNEGARDFRLFRAPVDAPQRENWREIVPHREGETLIDFELFDRHVVVQRRVDGMSRFEVFDLEGTLQRELGFDEPVYDAAFEVNRESDEPVVRIGYSSLSTPDTVYSFDLDRGERETLKVMQVGLGYNPSVYVCERLWATSHDGARVPISVVRRRDLELGSGPPCVLYGYGAYGICVDPGFSPTRVSLLERGVVFAIAHVRGGSERGRGWYEMGRLEHKTNSFLDFIAAAEHLVAEGYASPSTLTSWGGSAGGLLVGASYNMRPDLFHAMIAQVPFVDIVTTMLDETIPLTTGEYDEWGDPREKEAYERMLSYSPYDNVPAGISPRAFVLSGLHDSQVQYFEPTKWVAKMRALCDGAPDVLLHTNTEAGHGGASGRFDRWRETAMIYGYILSLGFGVSDES